MAAADSGRPIRGAIYRHIFPLRDASGAVVSGATGLAPTYSLNGESFSACSGTVTEIGTSGVYYLDLTAAEMAAASVIFRASSSQANTHVREIVTEPCLNSGTAAAGTVGSLTLATGASSSNNLYGGAVLEILRGTGAGQVRTITAYAGGTRIATVDRNWVTTPDTSSVYVIHPRVGAPQAVLGVLNADAQQLAGDATAATLLAALYTGGVVAASVNDATPTTGGFNGSSALGTTDDFYNNMLLVFTSGDLAGYVSRINDYTGATRTLALTTALPQAPANGDLFCILSKVF